MTSYSKQRVIKKYNGQQYLEESMFHFVFVSSKWFSMYWVNDNRIYIHTGNSIVNQEFSWRQLCHQWQHQWLSQQQPAVPPVKTKSASWQLFVFSNTVHTIVHHYRLGCKWRYQWQPFYKYSLGGGGLFSPAQWDWFSDNFHPINSRTIYSGVPRQNAQFSLKYSQQQSHSSPINVNNPRQQRPLDHHWLDIDPTFLCQIDIKIISIWGS